MCAAQREFRGTAVIEPRIRPACSRVTGPAIPGKTCGRVVRIRGSQKIFSMAAGTVGRLSRKIAVLVAGCAFQLRVSARKHGSRFNVIKPGAAPAVNACVARPAGNGKCCSLVIRRLRRSVIPQMAGGAVCIQTLVQTGCSALVTGLAIRSCVRAKERETVRMIFRFRHRDAPASNGMAFFAVASHPASMKVRVAIGALFPDIGECEAGVALPAIQSRMHATKRKASLRMIEVGERPNRIKAR